MIDLHRKYGYLSDDAWRDLLINALRGRLQHFELPSYPPAEIQEQFVGSSYAAALNEARAFYRYFKQVSANLGAAFRPEQKILDFGCGWGRFIWLIGKDFSANSVHAVDVDPDILKTCTENRLPGQFQRVEPLGPLAIEDSSIDRAMSYSVFTHLPEHVHLHWMRELARVIKPGGILAATLQPRRFLDFIESVAPQGETGWHKGMAQFAARVPELREKFDNGEFIYLPTGGGDYRPNETYGEAIVSPDYIRSRWDEFFELIEYTDDRFTQAVLIVRRK